MTPQSASHGACPAIDTAGGKAAPLSAPCKSRGNRVVSLAMSKPLPIRLDRALSANLADQLSDGLRAAIETGYYRKGELLPTIVELARDLGTSVQVPRTAIATLAAEGLVSPRRGVGCIVLGRGQSVWKGRVLGVIPAEREGAYHATTLMGEMRRALSAAGYLFEVVVLDRRPGGSLDFARLDIAMRRSVDFAFPLHCPAVVRNRLERAGIPFALKPTSASSGISGPQIGDTSAFLARCRAAGVRRILVAGFGSGASLDVSCEPFRAAGLEVEPRLARCQPGPGFLERLEHLGMEMVLRRFATARETWPQLVLWTDDFLATGGLMGLQERGISAPRDIFLATIANRGFVPVYPPPRPPIELDPAETGRAAAAEILRRIAGEPPRPIPETVRYIPGETL